MNTLSAKIIATLLTLALIALAACGGASQATEAPATANLAPTTQAPDTPTFAFSDPANRITVLAATPTPLPEADMQATAEAEEAANYPRLRTPGPLAEATPEPAPDTTEPPFVVSISPAVDDALSGIYVQPDCLTHYRNMLVEQEPPDAFGPEVAEQLWNQFLEDRSDCAAQGFVAQFADDYVCYYDEDAEGTYWRGGYTVIQGSPDRFMSPLTNKNPDSYGNFSSIYLNFTRMPRNNTPGCWYYDGQSGVWHWLIANGDGTGERGINTFYAPVCDFLLREDLAAKAQAEGSFDPEDILASQDQIRLIDNYPECATHTEPQYLVKIYFWNSYPSDPASAGCATKEPTGVTSTGNYVVNWDPDEVPPGDGTVCWVRYASTGKWKGYTKDGSEVPLFDIRDYVEDWDGERTASP